MVSICDRLPFLDNVRSQYYSSLNEITLKLQRESEHCCYVQILAWSLPLRTSQPALDRLTPRND